MATPRESRGRPEGWLVAAVALVFLMGTGVLGYLLVSSPYGRGSAAAPSLPTAGATPNNGPADASAGSATGTAAPDPRLAQVTDLLRGRGYRVNQVGSTNSSDCADNAYGGTQVFLAQHRCVGLRRALLEVYGQQSGSALVAISWVGMPDQSGAAQLRTQLDRPGSGNIIPLARGDSRYRSVVFNGIYYASNQQDLAVVSAEAATMAPGLTAAQLRNIAATAAS
ncbi:MAG TPA: hypothetical protein VH141_07520 [Pseudonocardia sp.]|nr:hypothetical protein [Pseudonocardia sp.]